MPQAKTMTPEVQDFLTKGYTLIQAATELSGQPMDDDTLKMLSAVRTLCGSLITALDLLRASAARPVIPQSGAHS